MCSRQQAPATVPADAADEVGLTAAVQSPVPVRVLAEFDGVLDGMSTDEVVEDAILDLDELIAAAIWGGHRGAVSEVASKAAVSIGAGVTGADRSAGRT